MRLTQLRFASTALASLALFALAAGSASIALAAPGGPTVVLSTATASPTNSASVSVTATFSEPVTGFALGDIQATNATASGLSGSGAVYTYTLTPVADGTVTTQVPADMANSVASSTGNQISNTLSFVSDKTNPTISSVVATPSSSSATITWTTNESANGQVAYGTTSSYGSNSTLAAALTTSHTATLSGLTPSTTYHFQVKSTDGGGNQATTTDATFTTTSVSPSAPVISGITATGVSTTSEQIGWTTDTGATSQVFYGSTTSYGSMSLLTPAASTTHSVLLSGLTEATSYHYVVVSSNAGGTSTSTDQTFTTNSTASSTPLAVTGIDAVNSTATADGTFNHGFKWVIHFTVPTNETVFQMKFADFTMVGSSSTIPTANNVRYYSLQSSNAQTSGSAVVETDTNYGGALQLTGDTSSSTAGRQIDVVVETAVPTGTPTGVYSTTFGARSTP